MEDGVVWTTVELFSIMGNRIFTRAEILWYNTAHMLDVVYVVALISVSVLFGGIPIDH